MSITAILEPEPQTIWPLAHVRAVEADPGESFFVITVSFPSGDLHFSDAGVADETLGTIETLVESWPRDLRYGVDENEYRLPLPSYEVEIADPEGALNAELMGAEALGVYRASVVIRAGVTTLESSMWPRVFEGIVVKWSSPRRNVIRLTIAHDHDWLRRPILRHRVLRTDWPNADSSALNRLIPLNYGTFDSRLDSGASALPTFYVDTRTSQWRFLVQRARCYDIFDVRLNGTVVAPGNYSLEFDTVGGLLLTLIRFLVDPGADPVVTIDLTGPEKVGDGSGGPIETYAAQLQHIITNFGHGDYRSGAWLDPANAPLDLGSFAEADDFLAANRLWPKGRFSLNSWANGRRTARAISTGIWGLDLVNECHGVGLKPYWTEAGKLALGFFDHRLKRIFLDGAHWIRDEDTTGDGARQLPNVRRTRDEMETPPLSVKDHEADWNSKELIANPWCQQALSEADLAPYDTTDEPVAWNIVPATSGEPHEVIAESVYAPDDDVSYAEWNAASATGTFRVRCRWADGLAVPSAHVVLTLLVNWRARYVANGGGDHTMKVGVRVGGVTTFGTVQTLTTDWTDYTDEFPLNGSAAWTMDVLALTEFEVSATHTASQDKPQITMLRPRVHYAAGGTAKELVRERLSRELLLAKRPPRITEATVNLHRAAIRACDPVSITSDGVQAPGGEGWGFETWERRLHFMLSRRLNLSNGTAVLRLIDARDLVVPIWETGVASAPAPEAAGIVRLGSWPAGRSGEADGRRFSRPTDPTDGDPIGTATVTHPSGDGTYTAAQDTEKYNDVGLLIEPITTPFEADTLKYLVRHDAQTWPIEGGTAVFKFIVP